MLSTFYKLLKKKTYFGQYVPIHNVNVYLVHVLFGTFSDRSMDSADDTWRVLKFESSKLQ